MFRMSKVDEAAKFIFTNVDFFAQSLMPETSMQFQAWATTQSEKLLPLSTSMHKALLSGRKDTYYMCMAKFRNAICGIDYIPGLLHGDIWPIMHFLKANPKMVNAILKHKSNPIIDDWYSTQATADQRNARSKVWQIHLYKRSVSRRERYLQNQIAMEVNKIRSNKELDNLYSMLNINNKQASQSRMIKRQEITIALITQYGSKNNAVVEKQLDAAVASNIKLAGALTKHKVIVKAQSILNNQNKAKSDIINTFHRHIKDNEEILLKRRDSGFDTFMKGLAVAGAAILTFPLLGCGGYFAYQRLFGAKATTTSKLFREVAKIKNSVQEGTESLQHRFMLAFIPYFDLVSIF